MGQFSPALAAAAQYASITDLSRLSIEELAQVHVTSVSKTSQPLSEAAAAVYVITAGDIRRSGVNSVPEALRLAPNLQVARLDANTYAITARGFNQSSATANKLLVLIDGRAVYSPLFSGTFWDAQNVMLADIERIEVVSGPGGTLWGANAVNGVINIITRSSSDTQGLLVDVRGGSLDDQLAIRYGGKIGDNATFRVYGLGFTRGAMATAVNHSARDSWNNLQGGFRTDWHGDADGLTLQGDIYQGLGIGHPGVLNSGSLHGGNVSALWTHNFEDSSNLRVQSYFDNQDRQLVSAIDANVDQYAVDAQYSFHAWDRNDIVVGAGYRGTHDSLRPGPGTVFLSPAERTLGFANLFAQDSITLSDSLKLTLGLKVEHNTYSGLEFMPDARLSWMASDNTLFWLAASRAVRTPSRFDKDLINPGILSGGPDFDSEDLTAFEAGYRGVLGSRLSLSASLYYNIYDNLRTVEATPPFVFPLTIKNGMRGDTYGLEIWGNAGLTDWWRLSAGVNFFEKNLSLKPGSLDIFGTGFAGNDPDYQFQIRSDMDLPNGFELNLWLRDTSSLPSPAIHAHLEADARIAWHATDTIELAIDGQNLLHRQHLEFINPSLPAEYVPRSVTFSVRWEL